MPVCQDRKEVGESQAFGILGSNLVITNTFKLVPLVHPVANKLRYFLSGAAEVIKPVVHVFAIDGDS